MISYADIKLHTFLSLVSGNRSLLLICFLMNLWPALVRWKRCAFGSQRARFSWGQS